jgi:LysR family transcriptional regulator, hydrogen peroxide-inducible genes activator
MISLPSFRQLEHLVLVSDHGHFGRAAKAGHVTQSTLSASIKELENVLQASLVDRTKRRVVLTPLGLEIVERARRILAEGKDLVEAARAGSEPLTGILRMGVIPTVGPFLLPDVLPHLRRIYPDLRLYLTEDLTVRLVEDLRAGRLDVVLLALPDEECKTLEVRVLFQDPFKFALPSNHLLAGGKSVDIEQVNSEELLLLKDGHCLREHALAACRLANRRQVESVEATSLHLATARYHPRRRLDRPTRRALTLELATARYHPRRRLDRPTRRALTTDRPAAADKRPLSALPRPPP